MVRNFILLRGKAIISYSLRLFRSLAILRTFPKIISAFSSFVIFIFVLRNLGVDSFARLQVIYGLTSIFLWVLDFGLMKSYIENFSTGQIPIAKNIWTLKSLSVCISLFLVPVAFIFGFTSSQQSFFICVAILDLFTDSFVEPRIVNSSTKQSIIFQISKKLSLLIIIILLTYSGNQIGPYELFIIYALVCGFFLLKEQHRLGANLIIPINKSEIRLSAKYWLQSAGVQLLNLDVLILNSFGAKESVILLSGIRRISGAIGLFGATRSTQIFAQILQSKKGVPSVGSILDIFVATFVPVVLVSVVLSDVIVNLFGFKESESSVFMGLSLLFLTPFGVLGALLSNILLALKKFNLVTFVNFISSVIYLFLLVYLGSRIDTNLAVAFGNIVYTLISVILFFVALHQIKKWNLLNNE